jgi:hypothetical protein
MDVAVLEVTTVRSVETFTKPPTEVNVRGCHEIAAPGVLRLDFAVQWVLSRFGGGRTSRRKPTERMGHERWYRVRWCRTYCRPLARSADVLPALDELSDPAEPQTVSRCLHLWTPVAEADSSGEPERAREPERGGDADQQQAVG